MPPLPLTSDERIHLVAAGKRALACSDEASKRIAGSRGVRVQQNNDFSPDPRREIGGANLDHPAGLHNRLLSNGRYHTPKYTTAIRIARPRAYLCKSLQKLKEILKVTEN